MSSKLLSALAVGALTIPAVGGLVLWMDSAPAVELEPRLTDVAAETAAGTMGPAADAALEEVVDLEGEFVELARAPIAESASWPRFRGKDSRNVLEGGTPLADSWRANGPPVLWGRDLGEGHAGAAVFGGRVFVLDYDEEEQGDALRCFSLEDGTEFWRRWYVAPTKRNHGISRTIPAVTEDFIVTIGPRCFVMCVDTETGAYRWGIDLVREYGTEVPLWYTGQCPIIENDTAVIAPAGDEVLMMGVDCSTGEVLWSTPNPGNWEMSHSSIIPMTILGKRMYVYCAMGGVAGVSAEPEDLGELQWTSTEWSHSVTSPSAVSVDESRVFLTAGYGGGSMMLRIAREEGSYVATPLFELDKKVFGCEQQTPIFYEGHLFGVLPKDASALREQFVCLDTDGKIVWSSGKTERFGLGPFLIADGKVLILDDDGVLTMLRASLEGYQPLARAKVLDGHDAWAPMALVDGKLLLRDSKHMICLDLTAAANPPEGMDNG